MAAIGDQIRQQPPPQWDLRRGGIYSGSRHQDSTGCLAPCLESRQLTGSRRNPPAEVCVPLRRHMPRPTRNPGPSVHALLPTCQHNETCRGRSADRSRHACPTVDRRAILDDSDDRRAVAHQATKPHSNAGRSWKTDQTILVRQQKEACDVSAGC